MLYFQIPLIFFLLVEIKSRALYMVDECSPLHSNHSPVNYFIGSYQQASDIPKHTQEQGLCPTGYTFLSYSPHNAEYLQHLFHFLCYEQQQKYINCPFIYNHFYLLIL